MDHERDYFETGCLCIRDGAVQNDWSTVMLRTFLDVAEVAQLTGRTRSDAQVRALRFMGVEHRVRPDGSVAVLRSHVQQVFGGSGAVPSAKAAEPDWSAI